MDISKRIGKVVGLYLLIISLAMLINMNTFMQYLPELIHQKPLMFMIGFFTLIIGLILVVMHNVWEWSWRVIITVVGWMVLLKALSLILYPHFIDQMTLAFINYQTFAYSAAAFDLVLGLILCYFSFKSTRG